MYRELGKGRGFFASLADGIVDLLIMMLSFKRMGLKECDFGYFDFCFFLPSKQLTVDRRISGNLSNRKSALIVLLSLRP